MAAARGSATFLSHNSSYDSDFPLSNIFCGDSLRVRGSSYFSLACFPSRTSLFDDNPRLKFVNESPLFKLSLRSEVSPDGVIKSKPSSLSALELLKRSGADRYTKETSSILVVGINHQTTPIDIREKISIPEAQWPRAIGELCALNHIEEAAVLSTCNRTEIYVVALSQHRGIKEVTEWLSKISAVPISELCKHRFLLYNKDATRHLFEVSSGLNSLVLGEGQILSQVKQVVKTGQGVPGFDRKISGLFKHAITVGKRVRSETSISTGSVSVSSASVELALMKLPECSMARMLVVGAGKMGKLVIKHLAAKGFRKIVVVNRTPERVASISEELKDVEIIYKPLSDMLASAAEADVIFTCTASDNILFSKDQVKKLTPVSSNVGSQRLFIDISVPRNIEPSVSSLENVSVYNVDDLKEVVASNQEERLQKATEAQSIIAEEVRQFESWKDSLETVPTIKKLRTYAERIRASEVEKCLSKMGNDVSKEQKKAISDLSAGIVNKLLHGPMQHLRCDESDNRSLDEILENMQVLNRIYNLDMEISVLEQKVREKIRQNQK